MVGAKLDKKAKAQQAEYHFIFVHSDGEQLKAVSKMVADKHIVPAVDPKIFTIDQVNDAINYMKKGGTKGKVVISFE